MFSSVLFHLFYNAAGILIAFGIVSGTTDELANTDQITAAVLLRSLPAALVTLAMWTLLCYAAMRRGEARRKNPLPDAPRTPLGLPVIVLLILTGLALAAYETHGVLALLDPSA